MQLLNLSETRTWRDKNIQIKTFVWPRFCFFLFIKQLQPGSVVKLFLA